MMDQVLQLLGMEDFSGVQPEVKITLSFLMSLWVLSEAFRLLRIVLYRIFGGDR